MKLRKHNVVFAPGLGDDNPLLRWEMKRFESNGFVVHVHPAPWGNKNEELKPKLERLIRLIENLAASGDKVSLVGISAGASLVLNAYILKTNKITGVVNLFGRLRSKSSPSLNFAARNSSAFKESVLMFEKNETKLTNADRKKILTVRAMFDETVPLSTTPLAGAKNIQVPLIEHTLSIYLGVLIYKRVITDFLRERSKE